MVGPISRNKLLTRICPCIRIMEIKHKLHSCVLNLLAKLCHVRNILANALALTLLGSFVGVYEEAHAGCIPSALLEELQWFYLISLSITEYGASLLILGQH